MGNYRSCEGRRYSSNFFLLTLAVLAPALLAGCSQKQNTDISFQLAYCGDSNPSNDFGSQLFTSLPKGRTLSAQDGTHLTVVGKGKLDVKPASEARIKMEVREDTGANMLTLESNLLIIKLLATANPDGTTNLAIQEQCATPDIPKTSFFKQKLNPQNPTALWVGRQSRRRI